MTKRPNFEDLCAKASGCYKVMCRCGSGLSCQQNLFDHWQRGHFDVFENEEPRAKKPAAPPAADVVGLDDETVLRALVDRIRSGLTELEVEVNRFELSRDAANDDVAEAVDEVAAEMVLGLARLRVTVHKIANHAEHQFTTTDGE